MNGLGHSLVTWPLAYIRAVFVVYVFCKRGAYFINVTGELIITNSLVQPILRALSVLNASDDQVSFRCDFVGNGGITVTLTDLLK